MSILHSIQLRLTNSAATGTAASAPMPKGHPSRAPFIVGGIGMLLLLIGATLEWIIGLILPASSIMDASAYVLMAIGATLGAVGFFGYRVNYGLSIALTTGVLTLIFAWWLPAVYLAQDIINMTFMFPLDMIISTVLNLIAVEFFAALLILWGVAMIKARGLTGYSGVGLAAGVLFIIAGAFWCSLILNLVGAILLIPACIVGMVSLFISRPGKA